MGLIGLLIGRGQDKTAAHREAAREVKLAPDQENADAQYNLAALYAEGGGGLLQNDGEAARLYKLTADQGDPFAQCALGLFYERGGGGYLRTIGRQHAPLSLLLTRGSHWRSSISGPSTSPAAAG